MKNNKVLLILVICVIFLITGCDENLDLIKNEYQAPISIYIEEDNNITSSIKYNFSTEFNEVECNTPIEIKYDEIFDISNFKVTILNSDGETLLSRIEYMESSNRVLVIPGEMMKPENTDSCEIKGLKNCDHSDFSKVYSFKTNDLDFGLYFFGEGNICEKYLPGVPNQYYDPTMPMVVLTMGWSPYTAPRNF